jgi:hypothetical protein
MATLQTGEVSFTPDDGVSVAVWTRLECNHLQHTFQVALDGLAAAIAGLRRSGELEELPRSECLLCDGASVQPVTYVPVEHRICR